MTEVVGEGALLRASITATVAPTQYKYCKAKAHWGKLRMSRKFGNALKSASENTKAMEEGWKGNTCFWRQDKSMKQLYTFWFFEGQWPMEYRTKTY